MMNQNKINFNFTYFALKTLGNNLYSNPWVAVSELVANGLDAKATQVKIVIDLRNKESATIEIFDNGTGMTYEDLAEKYAIIGRNRRESENSEVTLGRKGVGKLATLYLTSHYYIATKKDGDYSTWEVNTTKYKDSDIPGLERIDNLAIQYLGKQEWDKFATGTMIKLVNVNLKPIGEQKLKSLKAILADYYLASAFKESISVAVIFDNSPIVFEKIEKKLYIDALYGIFDNTGLYSPRMKETVYITGEDDVYPEVDYPRQTVILNNSNFPSIPTNGTLKMKDVNGNLVDVPYELTGWIGVNCSLKEEIQKRNSSNYKKLTYRSNELKLYVRGKLAVADLMKYIGSTHAISNYIEGEISFDVLDRNDLEDIATSNREGYKLDDPRIEKLLDIVRPIIRRLINERAEVGNAIKKQNEALAKAKETETKSIKEAKDQVEKELKKISKEKKEIEAKNEVANKRLFVLERNFIGNGEDYKNGMHLAVNYAKAIKSKAIKLSRTAPKQEIIHLIDIAGYSENIIRLNKMLGKAKFSLDSPSITENLFGFIKDYMNVISTSSLKCEYDFQIDSYMTEFDFCEMSMALENIVSNSKKARAHILSIKSLIVEGKKYLLFSDNGNGISEEVKNNDDIFKLGFTTTGGYGIGAYFIKKVFEKITNSITVENRNGFCLIMELK